MSPSSPATTTKRPLLGDVSYQILKHAATTGLPGLITLYFTLAQIWHWSNTAQVMGTLTAINTAIGVLLGVSSYSYHNSDAPFDGEIRVANTEAGKTIGTLVFNNDPEKMLGQQSATLKIMQEPDQSAATSNPTADAQHLNL